MSRRDTEPLSAQITAHLIDSALFRGAQYLYAYYPLGNEADVRLAAQTAWQEGKRVAFPKVSGDAMRFFEVTGFGQLAEGTFGVMEPVETAGALPAGWQKDLLVLVPGVAFDRQGNRIGYGKGYYDRYFAEYAAASPGATQYDAASSGVTQYDAASSGVTLVGVAYESQVADCLPAKPYDLTVSYLVTEKGIFHTGSG